ncbi:MAG: hypothetical protein QOE31_1541 [Solirubrobacteraceae bacterium]|nr:hypothetical protein [Solirubrobacteraceae bacterium]
MAVTPAGNGHVSVRGHVEGRAPSRAGPRRTWRVELQRRSGSAWRTVAFGRLQAPYWKFTFSSKAPAGATSFALRVRVRSRGRVLETGGSQTVRAGASPTTGGSVLVPAPMQVPVPVAAVPAPAPSAPAAPATPGSPKPPIVVPPVVSAPAGNKLLIADLLHKRLLITDFSGRVVWQMKNPTGNPSSAAGPLGVRWLPNKQILATFGTGEVGVIDVARKSWVWQTKGYSEVFQSPYDAELLPDGNLAVATRWNDGGRIAVYNRTTGREVWRQLVPEAHSVHFRTAAQSYNSDLPTLLMSGFGEVKEVTYNPGGTPTVTWRVASEYSHDAIVVENDRVITTEGYYIQKIDRAGTRLWSQSTPDEDRRVAMNPSGGYIFSVGEGDRIEFRDVNGTLQRSFSRLSDGTSLDFPYGIQVVDYPG